MRRARRIPARSRHGDAQLLRRAAWTVALQTALAVALVVLVVTAGSVLLFDRQQAQEVKDVLQHAATTADDVTDPPVGVWLVQVPAPQANTPAQRTVSAGTPQPAAQAPVLDSAPPGPLTIAASSQQWSAWVELRASSRFVAIYDWSRHTSEEHRLLVAITTAGLVGIALAALIGLRGRAAGGASPGGRAGPAAPVRRGRQPRAAHPVGGREHPRAATAPSGVGRRPAAQFRAGPAGRRHPRVGRCRHRSADLSPTAAPFPAR